MRTISGTKRFGDTASRASDEQKTHVHACSLQGGPLGFHNCDRLVRNDTAWSVGMRIRTGSMGLLEQPGTARLDPPVFVVGRGVQGLTSS